MTTATTTPERRWVRTSVFPTSASSGSAPLSLSPSSLSPALFAQFTRSITQDDHWSVTSSIESWHPWPKNRRRQRISSFFVWIEKPGQDQNHAQHIYIDLQQVFLLRSEAHKNKTLMFICEYFRLHGRVKHWQHLLTKRNNLDFKTFTFKKGRHPLLSSNPPGSTCQVSYLLSALQPACRIAKCGGISCWACCWAVC